ncbi:hypothetical protein FAM23868_001959 [Propionibacterium freudenreichii]|uniref:hypothetical protein n=1 Tax=Propionibacterium freudenreichii TaxID=1744 RepID=UPI00254ACA3D|nr:hypothetical protein [Propionibacterium freudenreichii]MDK9332619.1 hypothetical protein [Propionibacterium freudenreichii]
MTTTDIAIPTTANLPASSAELAHGSLRNWAASLVDAGALSKAIVATDFVPAHFRGKTGDAAVAIMKGAAIGLDPIAALESIYVVSGKPALYARSMAAIVLAAGHELWTEAEDDGEVTVSGRRAGSEHVESITWTIERAKLAGYTSNKKYATDSRSMLYARAVGDVCRRIAPDVLLGLSYTAEELELDATEPVKVQRRRRKHTTTQEPAADEVQADPTTGEVLDAEPVEDGAA